MAPNVVSPTGIKEITRCSIHCTDTDIVVGIFQHYFFYFHNRMLLLLKKKCISLITGSLSIIIKAVTKSQGTYLPTSH